MNRFLLKIKTLLVILIFAASAQIGNSQALLVEDFDYPTGDALLSHNWVIQGTTTTNPLLIGAQNLTRANYPMATGFSVPLVTSGQDAYSGFTSQTTGSIYMAFLINVTAASTGDYFISFKEAAGTSFYYGRVFIKKDAIDATKFNLGISKSSTTVVYTTEAYSLNTTYLAVIKYSFITGTVNDEAYLFVEPSIPGNEPTTPTITASDIAQTDANSISCVLVRQGTAASAPTLSVDGIRIATTWADAIADAIAPVTTIVPSDAVTDIAVNVIPTITFDEAVRNTDASEITNANLSSIVKFKKTNSLGEDVACTMTIDAAKKVITLTPTAALDNSQAYYVECGEVEDAFGNTGVVKSSTFTTIGAATPVITLTAPVGSETFYAGQAVSITWTSANITNVMVEAYVPTADVYNWITLSASVAATEGKLDYTIPADADYGTGYKIRVSDASAATVNSESAVFTVNGVATSLTDLKARFVVGDVVKLNSQAIISFISGKNYYMQDANSGILMYDSGTKITTTYSQYDGITGVTGKLDTYSGVLEFIPAADPGAATSTGNTLTPVTLTPATLNTDYNTYESMLIKITGVTFADAGVPFVKSTNYNISDGVNTTVFRAAFATSDIIGTTIPKKVDIIGLAMEYNTTAQIASRNLADITVYSSAKAITAFAFNGLTPAVVATIDESAKTIAATVPAGTVVTALVPTITVSDKATVAPLSGVGNDFTNAVTYTVTAEDGTTQAYVVTVTILTGVDKNAEAVIAIGPVPAKTCLNINNIESVKLIEIFNVAGVKVETVRCEGNSTLPLSVENYKPGYYFIRFTTADGVIMKKFIKQ